jgi:hypothetical protein
MDFDSGSPQWDVSFFRAACDWEVNVLASFFTLLYSIRVRREGKDKLWWTRSHIENFYVRSLYKVLGCKDEAPFHWKSIWQPKVPLKVAFLFLIFISLGQRL